MPGNRLDSTTWCEAVLYVKTQLGTQLGVMFGPETATDFPAGETAVESPARIRVMEPNSNQPAPPLAERVRDLRDQVLALQGALEEIAQLAEEDGVTAGRAAVPDYLSVAEAAKYMSVSRATLYRLIDSGLPRVKVYGSTRLRRVDLDAYMESQTAQKESA